MRTVLEERVKCRQFETNSTTISGTHVIRCMHHTLLSTLFLCYRISMTRFVKDKHTWPCQGQGHVCLYLPKFHCELNPIENCWCHDMQAHCNGSIVHLRKIIFEAFDTVTTDMIARFFCKCDDYQAAYLEGHSCHTVDKAIKRYKSHRSVGKYKSDSNG